MILRNEISENNNLFKVSGTLNKVLLIFVFKRIPNYKNISNINPFSLYYELCHTWNPDIFIIRGISEHWNIPKFNGIYIPVKQIVMSFGIIILC